MITKAWFTNDPLSSIQIFKSSTFTGNFVHFLWAFGTCMESQFNVKIKIITWKDDLAMWINKFRKKNEFLALCLMTRKTASCCQSQMLKKIVFPAGKNNQNWRTIVINDPLGQPHSHTSIEHYSNSNLFRLVILKYLTYELLLVWKQWPYTRRAYGWPSGSKIDVQVK